MNPKEDPKESGQRQESSVESKPSSPRMEGDDSSTGHIHTYSESPANRDQRKNNDD